MVLKSSMYFPAYGRARTGEINLRILNIHIRIPSAGIVHCAWGVKVMNVLFTYTYQIQKHLCFLLSSERFSNHGRVRTAMSTNMRYECDVTPVGIDTFVH